MKHFPILTALCLTTPAFAQAVQLDDLLKAKPASLPEGAPAAMEHIDRADLAKHAFWFASDEIGGRHTGTPGQFETARYIAEYFASLGLEPLGDEGEDGKRGWLQNYDVARTHLDLQKLRFTVDGEIHESGFGVLPGRNKSIAVEGKLVYCGRGRRADMPKEFAEGDVPVVILPPKALARPLPTEMQFMMGFREVNRANGIARNIQRRGGKTMLLLDVGNRLADVMQYGGILPGKPNLSYGNEVGMSAMLGGGPMSFFVVGKPLAEQLMAKLSLTIDEDGKVAQTEPPGDVNAVIGAEILSEGKFEVPNVVAWLEGSDPQLKNEAVVFSAHMDHMGTRLDGQVFNGADDNASGSSALLEVAQAFAKGEKPRRSVIFLSVSGEELGLWGSAHYANNPTWPVDKIVANVNIDMIGRATELSGEDEISITPSYKHRKFSSIARDSAKLAESLGLGLTIGDMFYERSDHYNFAVKGIPVVFYCDGEHPDYHQVTDTPDKLDYGKIERVTRLAFWTGWNVCQSGERPEELGRRADWSGAEDEDR